MSNQYGDTTTAAVDMKQLSRLHQTICDMNPVGVRTVFSSLPQPTHEILLGIYDITVGSGVEVSIIKNDITLIRYIQLDATHNPLLEIAMGGIVIRPSNGGYNVSKHSPGGRVILSEPLSNYRLLEMTCKQWPKQLGWLSDICARLYPFAASPLPMVSDIDYPEILPIEDSNIAYLAEELYSEQVIKYANGPGVTVNANELRVNLTPIERNGPSNERGFVLVHRPDNKEVPLIIKTFNCEDNVVTSYSRIHIEGASLPTLCSLDLLIENAIAMTPQNGIGPSMSDDLRTLRESVNFQPHTDDDVEKKESLYNQVSKYDVSNNDSKLSKSIIVRTTFHGRLTRIVLTYKDNHDNVNYLNQSFYSQQPLNGRDIAARACNIVYKIEEISGDHVENLIKWIDSLETQLTKTFG